MILQKIQTFIDKQALFQADDRLLLAISGGIDSVVLLYLLLELGYQPALIHCNFQLRGQASEADENFIKTLADKHHLAVYTKRFETEEVAKNQGVSIQMMARDQRYAYFEEIRSEYNYDYILTAHHLDDRIETFLLNFLRGTGFAGLRSIPSSNQFIRRPLLFINRQEILDYQAAHQIDFREDESNTSDKYKRNFLRHHVLPKLYELSPQLAHTAQQNFERFDEMFLLYQERVDELKAQMMLEKEDEIRLDLVAIRSHPTKKSLLWSFMQNYDFTAEQQRQFLEAKKGTVLETEYYQALVGENELIIEKKKKLKPIIFWQKNQPSISLESGDQLSITLHSKMSNYKTNTSEIVLDVDRLQYPLKIRNWQAGDRFCPFGMKGKSQKLKDFFINNKINRLDRHKTPILVNGNDEIIWIIGYRMDDRYGIRDETENVGRIKYKSLLGN